MSAQTMHKSQKVSKADVAFNIILYGICGLILLLIAYPLYFIIIASFSNPSEVSNGNVWLWPSQFTLDGYKELLRHGSIWMGYVKSRTGTGALGDLGSHALDLVRFVTNKEYTRVVGHTGTYVHERPLLDGKGVGKVDVDDFSNYMADMEDEISVSFQITRFAYGRGNYQRMEIYGSEGAIVYSLDATPAGIDEIEVCSGDINADAHVFNHLPIPQQYFCDQMQSFADIVNGTGDGLAANIQDGQANQHLLDAIVESAEKGTWLSL